MIHINKKSKDLLKQKNLHIIPFFYDSEYIDAIKSIQSISKISNKGNKIQYWNYDKITSSRLYEHVTNQFTNNLDNPSLCTRFKLSKDQDVRVEMNIPKNKSTSIKLWCKNNLLGQFILNYVNIYLFDFNVGFLVLEITVVSDKETQEEIVKDIIDVNYYLKKYGYKDYKISFSENCRISKDDIYENEEEFTLKNWISGFIPLENKSFFEKDINSFAYPLTSICFKEKLNEEFIKGTLFKLRHSFKESYKPNMLYEDNTDEVYQPFEYMYWGLSTEGCCSIQYYIEDKESNNYINSLYSEESNFNIYLKIILIVLYWKYASLMLLQRVREEEFGVKSNKNSIESSDIKKIEDISEHFIKFKLKSFFTDASNISHINKFFKILREVQGIKDLTASIDEILQTLSYKTEIIQQKQKQIRKDMIDKLVFTVTLIFLVLQTVAATVSLNPIFINTFNADLSTSIYKLGGINITGYLLIITIIFAILIIALRQYKNKM